MPKRKVDRGVILAAGDGDRLGSLTISCPKVLLPVKDKTPLITYPIEALVSAGISEIAIVVGYLGDKVIDGLGSGASFGVNLQYITNPHYLGGGAISLYQARDWAQSEPIVLCMGDHLINGELVRRLLDRQSFSETLCIDYTPAQYHEIAEATKVAVDHDACIKDIGKELVYWDALDTGVFMVTRKFFQAVQELIQQFGVGVEITDVVRFLISQGHCFQTCDVSGSFWVDVDTEEDLNLVRM